MKTAAELAALVGGKIVRGNKDVALKRVMPTHEAASDAVTFVSRPEYLEHLKTSRAAAALLSTAIAEECDAPDSLTIIAVDDVYVAFARAAQALAPPSVVVAGVHPSAVVDASADLASDVSVGPFCVIGARSRIGSGAVLYAGVHVHEDCDVGSATELRDHVVLRPNSVVGSQCILHPGVVVGADGFGYAQAKGADGAPEHLKIPQTGRVIIEDDVEIGANCCIDRATFGETRIGRGSKIDNLVQLGHNVRVGPGSIIVAQAGVAGSSSLGAGVTLGAQSGISGHLSVGAGATVYGQSGVMEDVPEGAELMGSPATNKTEHLRSVVHVRRLNKLVQRLRSIESQLKPDKQK